MKKLIRKTKGIVKGAPSAVLISAAIHAALLVVAGGCVVFKAIQKKEAVFVPPPPVDRPKMELKKPRVKVKKQVKPKATQRIVSKNVHSMPDIALPDMSSMGSGLSGGVGGFEMMPDPSELSLFGGKKSMAIGNDLEGTFYSFQYDRRGKEIAVSPGPMDDIIERFVKRDWNPRVFAPYYRSPQKLYTTHLMIPPIASEHGPRQFGVSLGERVSPAFWVIHYKGQIARPEGGRFRFWATGDNFLILRVNKKIVFAAGFGEMRAGAQGLEMAGYWSPTSEDSGKYKFGHGWATVGDWFELEPGVPVEIEALFGDYYGGWFKAMVTVEDEAEDYPRNEDGLLVCPVFRTAEIPAPLINQLKYLLTRDEVLLDDPLMFNVY